jgi:hypothetical protein
LRLSLFAHTSDVVAPSPDSSVTSKRTSFAHRQRRRRRYRVPCDAIAGLRTSGFRPAREPGGLSLGLSIFPGRAVQCAGASRGRRGARVVRIGMPPWLVSVWAWVGETVVVRSRGAASGTPGDRDQLLSVHVEPAVGVACRTCSAASLRPPRRRSRLDRPSQPVATTIGALYEASFTPRASRYSDGAQNPSMATLERSLSATRSRRSSSQVPSWLSRSRAFSRGP